MPEWRDNPISQVLLVDIPWEQEGEGGEGVVVVEVLFWLFELFFVLIVLLATYVLLFCFNCLSADSGNSGNINPWKEIEDNEGRIEVNIIVNGRKEPDTRTSTYSVSRHSATRDTGINELEVGSLSTLGQQLFHFILQTQFLWTARNMVRYGSRSGSIGIVSLVEL